MGRRLVSRTWKTRLCRFNCCSFNWCHGSLAATILLKPRIGKFNKDGSANNLAGHNQVFTALSVLLLWVGWFGFNAGSTLSVDRRFFGFVAINTNLAAAAGTVAAMIISWIVLGKADVPMMLNGAFAGLVAITASCAFVDTWAAVLIGFIAGILVFYSIRFFESRKLMIQLRPFRTWSCRDLGNVIHWFFATKELATVGKPGLFYGGGFHQLGVQALGVIACELSPLSYPLSYYHYEKSHERTSCHGGRRNYWLDMSEHGSYGYPELLKLSKS